MSCNNNYINLNKKYANTTTFTNDRTEFDQHLQKKWGGCNSNFDIKENFCGCKNNKQVILSLQDNDNPWSYKSTFY